MTSTETSGFLNPSQTAEKFLKKVLSKASSRKLIFSDIDGTLVDSSLRFQLGKSFSEIEGLMDEIEDPPKKRVISHIESLTRSGFFLVFVTGRRRSLKTTEQLRRLGFENFFFLRNSTFYNPTLSSKFFKTALAEAVCQFSQKSLIREAVFVEDRADIVDSILKAVSQYETVRKRTKIDTFDNVFFLWL